VVPNALTKRAAEKLDLAKTQLWLVISFLFAVSFCVVRALEFTTLNCWWDSNAYGSIVWTLLGLHTTHFVTDAIDTGVLAAIMFTDRVDANRFVDISENAFYYYFVIVSWLPLYAVIYLAPRVI
jgi:cytochrome c oxidase subunit I+III